MLSAIIFATFISGAIAASCTEDAECGVGQQCIPLEYGCHNHYLGECRERSPWCTQEYSPVCSCSGISYSTECHAYAAGERIRAAGTCQNDDSATLGFNAGAAARNLNENNNQNENGGVNGAFSGEAQASGLSSTNAGSGSDSLAAQSSSRSGAGVGIGGAEGATCGTDADCVGKDDRAVYAGVGRNRDPPFCKYPVGSCEIADAVATSAGGGQTTENESGGVCTLKPLGCPRNYHPVCGCNGVTYPNACGAASAGVNVRAEGECAPGAEEARQEEEKSWGTEGISWNNRQGLGEATDNAADPRTAGMREPSAPSAFQPGAVPGVETPLTEQLKREEGAAARGTFEFGTEFNGLPRVPQAPQQGGQPQAPATGVEGGEVGGRGEFGGGQMMPGQAGVTVDSGVDQNVTAQLEPTRNMTANASGAFAPFMQNATESARNTTGSFFRGVGEALGGMYNVTVGSLGSAWNAARNATGGVINTTTSTVSGAVGGVYNTTRNATGNLLNTTATMAGTAFNATRNATSGFLNTTSGVGEAARNFTTNATSTLGAAAGNVSSGAKNFTAGAFNATSGAAGRLVNTTQGALGSAWNATANATAGAWNATANATASAWNTTTGAAGTAWNTTTGAAGVAWNATAGTAGTAWNATAGAAGSAWNTTRNVTGQVGGMVQNATNAALNTTSALYNRTVAGAEGLQNATANATGTFLNRTTGAANITLEALRNATSRFNETNNVGGLVNTTGGLLGNMTSNTTLNATGTTTVNASTTGGLNTTSSVGGGRLLRGPCTARNASVACGGGMFCRFEEGKCSGTEAGPRAALAVAEAEGDAVIGQCVRKPMACDRRYEPVCGCDGRTHASQCEAESNGVSLKHDGACEAEPEGEGEPCVSSTDCGEGFACLADDGICEENSAPGAATVMRGATTVQQRELEAQRGFDAEDARVQQQRTDEQIRRQEPEDEYPRAQLYRVGVGGTGSKKCVRAPTECSDVGQGLEVCGCDGQTYASRCAAHSVGVSVKHTRSCEDGEGGTGAGGSVGGVGQNGAEDLGGRPGQAWRVEGAGSRVDLEPTPSASGEVAGEREPSRSVDWERDTIGEDEDVVDSSRTKNLHIQRTRTDEVDQERTRDEDFERTRDTAVDSSSESDSDEERDLERTTSGRDEQLGAAGVNSRFGATRVPRRTATPLKGRTTATPRMSSTSTSTPRVPDDVGSHKEFVDWADRERVFAYAAPDAAWREALNKKLAQGKTGIGATGAVGDLSDEAASARPVCEEIECGAAAECVASGRCSRCFRCSDSNAAATTSTNINTGNTRLTPEQQLQEDEKLVQEQRDRELLLKKRDLTAPEDRREPQQPQEDRLWNPAGYVPGSVPFYDTSGAGVEVLDGANGAATTTEQRGQRAGQQLEAAEDKQAVGAGGSATSSSTTGANANMKAEMGAVGVVCESETFEDAVECFKQHACKGLIGSSTRCVIGGRPVECPVCDSRSTEGKNTLVEEVVVIDERAVGSKGHDIETSEPQWSKLLTVGIAAGVLVAAVLALVVAVVLLARRAIRADAANESWASHFSRINSGKTQYTDPTGDAAVKQPRGGERGGRGGYTDSSTVPVTSPLKEPRGVANL